jgi:hypothetical protein
MSRRRGFKKPATEASSVVLSLQKVPDWWRHPLQQGELHYRESLIFCKTFGQLPEFPILPEMVILPL